MGSALQGLQVDGVEPSRDGAQERHWMWRPDPPGGGEGLMGRAHQVGAQLVGDHASVSHHRDPANLKLMDNCGGTATNRWTKVFA
jgi:hypothetical protein